MVNAYQNVIRSLWTGLCDIIVRTTVINPSNGRNETVESVALQNEPCRISFSTIKSTTTSDSAEAITQTVKLFIARGIEIPEGSKIVVTQNGESGAYVKSGAPAVYSTHQEIILERFTEWA